MEGPLVNRVANSGIKTINLENHFPKHEIVELDIKQYLFKELLLKEKDFRNALKEIDWEGYKDKILLVYCSSDAIIPVWAYMLVAAYATPHAFDVFEGNQDSYLKLHYTNALSDIDFKSYEGDRVVIKGCSDRPVPSAAYALVTKHLQPYAQSIMYGEPCSTVPIFKRPRVLKKS